MSEPNYESKWWGYIYDQMMEEGLSDLLERNRRFYHSNLAGVSGPVLECACGTGLIMLPLLEAGHDMYGFDISTSMLATLEKKAAAQGLGEIDARISVQAFESFHYDARFDAIIIPTNTFSMLTTQEAQIRTLRNISGHLAPGGKLLMDIRLAGMRDLVQAPALVRGQWYTWTHPETGLPIRQRVDGCLDFDQQLTIDHCYIEYEGLKEDFPMTARWIFKDEFQLLLRLGGFVQWDCYSTPDRDALVMGLDDVHSYWIANHTIITTT